MLKEAFSIGKLQVKNRLVMPPVATYQSTEDGMVTEKMLDYYGKRAEGGNIGLIITEHSYVTLQGKAKAKQLSVADDSCMDGLKRLADVIHQNGTRAFIQINHAGSAASSAVSGMRPVAPSAVILPVKPQMGDGTLPDELTEEQIGRIVEAFASAAIRGKNAGFDGVEIHSAHAYLLNQFYSPLTNHREDAYGGSLENRMRLHRKVLRAVRDSVGADFLISMRLGGCDYCDGGSTVGDSVAAAKILEAEGADMISITGGMCRYSRPGHTEPGYFSDMSEKVKQAVKIPVLLVGGMKTAEQAEKFLLDGKADLIGVARELLKNPHWADIEMEK